MKKLRRMAIVLAVLWVLLTGTALAEIEFGVVYRTDSLNLRQQATQYSTWLAAYDRGDWLAISGETGNWYYVTGPDGKTGYVSKNYVQVEEPVYRSMGFVNNPKATSFLNLRAAPSYGATVVDYFYNGVPCVLLSQTNGWYHVRVDGVDGYFRQEYITTKTCASGEEAATIVTPNNTGLNLRFGPGMDYDALGQYRGGNYVILLQRGNDWWKVCIDGKVGYMKAEFLREGVLKPGEKTSEAAVESAKGTAVVSNPKTTQVLNLRSKPDTSSLVLGQFRNGEKLTLLDYGTEWCRVMDGRGQEGYMMTRYLTVKNLKDSATMAVDHPQKTFVNLRSSPSVLYGTVLTKMPQGAAVTVLIPSCDGWVKVSYNGYTGYAVNYFLK